MFFSKDFEITRRYRHVYNETTETRANCRDSGMASFCLFGTKAFRESAHHLVHSVKDFVLQLDLTALEFPSLFRKERETTSSHVNELFEMKQILYLS